MGNNYVWGNSIVKDFLFQLLLQKNDITEPEMKEGIEGNIKYILLSFGVRNEDLAYLEYEIKKTKGIHFKIIPDNILTAMWFSGYYPEKCDLIYQKNYAKFDNKLFKFNKKTKKLKWEKK